MTKQGREEPNEAFNKLDELKKRWHQRLTFDRVCPVSTDCLPLSQSTSSQSSLLVLRRTQMPQRGVFPVGVVEALDVREDRHPR